MILTVSAFSIFRKYTKKNLEAEIENEIRNACNIYGSATNSTNKYKGTTVFCYTGDTEFRVSKYGNIMSSKKKRLKADAGFEINLF